jgi:Glycosyl hydrolase family 81 C-terminal domain
MIAKLGRILTIGEELHEICTKQGANSIPEECNGLSIPGPEDQLFLDALARLRSSVEVWINGTADTPFIYDDAWGGMVSCGCDFDDKKGGCRNEYPDCPAFYDPGMDFGLSWFNDHHFHLYVA